MDLLDRCRARPGNNFGDGYGFALAYLDDHLTPAVLRDAACMCVGKAYGLHGTAEERKSDELASFVLAYGEAECFEDYAIQAAQLLLNYGMAGDFDAGNALATLGHPGYTYRTRTQAELNIIAADAINNAAGRIAETGDHSSAKFLRDLSDQFDCGEPEEEEEE
jgi:hypothetical protein